MAVVSTPESDHKSEEVNQTKGSAIRVVGRRIYDSENAKSCHQCRQKTMEFSAPCKNMKKDRQCIMKYCHKCLINRYGETAEDVAALVDWRCPKCRDICNCSLCMKRKGQSPTGILVHTAKKTGFSSVSDLLQAKGPGIYKYERIVKDIGVSPKKQTKESMATSPMMLGKENSFDGDCDAKVTSQDVTPSLPAEKKSKKRKREGLKELSNGKGGQEDSLDKTNLKKPKTLKKAAKKTEEQTDDPSGPRKGQEIKRAKSKKTEDLNGIKVSEETSKGRESTTSDEEYRKKLKSKEKYAGDGKKDIESNTIPPVKKKKTEDLNGIKVSEETSKGRESTTSHEESRKKLKSEEKYAGDEKKDIESNTIPPVKKKKTEDLNGIKVSEETSKGRESTTSGEESRKKLKSKEKHAGDEKKDLDSNTIPPVKKKKKSDVKSEDSRGSNGFKADNTSGKLYPVIKPDIVIQLPEGTSLITVAGVDLPPSDVGHALQFLEFCAAFGEVFDMKKGQAESVIREIIRGRGRCRLQYSPVVQFHTQLLSLIEKDTGNKFPPFSDNGSWFRALGQCMSESQCPIKEVSSDIYDTGVDAYNMLDSSIKLKLLNALCDEVLCTITMRDWIDEQNSKLADSGKEAREKVVVLREKEKQLRQKLQDEVSKTIIEKSGSLRSASKHEALIAQIKKEAAQAREDMLQAVGNLPNKRQRSDAVRTSPILLDVSGHVFWKLRGYTSENCILLQDIGTLDPVTPDEKWFVYDVEQKPLVEKYISSIRSKRLRIPKVSNSLPTASVGENLELA